MKREGIVIVHEHIPFTSDEGGVGPWDVGGLLKEIRIRVMGALERDERLAEYRLYDVGIIRSQDGFRVKLYFMKEETEEGRRVRILPFPSRRRGGSKEGKCGVPMKEGRRGDGFTEGVAPSFVAQPAGEEKSAYKSSSAGEMSEGTSFDL